MPRRSRVRAFNRSQAAALSSTNLRVRHAGHIVNELTAKAGGDTVVEQLRSLLRGDGASRAGEIVLYTSFGVVRGRLAPSFVRQLASGPAEESPPAPRMVEIYDATV